MKKKKPAAGYAEFMARAYVMEMDASERYADFADQMEVHNNPEVAELFRKLSHIEGLHAQRILEEMGWKQPPRALLSWRWDEDPEPPETAPVTELHYLMQPWHALELGLKNERRALKFTIAGREQVVRAAQRAQHDERQLARDVGPARAGPGDGVDHHAGDERRVVP